MKCDSCGNEIKDRTYRQYEHPSMSFWERIYYINTGINIPLNKKDYCKKCHDEKDENEK